MGARPEGVAVRALHPTFDEPQWLQLPHTTYVQLVDTPDKLAAAGQLLQEAYVCGIDAEWDPQIITPSASLVQLAIRCRDGREHALLLDMMAHPREALKDVLQPLFRSTSILKVGFGLVMDLWAISQRLGEYGAGCISVMDPQLDVGTLHRALAKQGAPGISKVAGQGLGSLVDCQLGRPLDKRLQCSAWAERPLSPAQVEYAALDAVCLLMLLDSYIALAPPAQYPINDLVPDDCDQLPFPMPSARPGALNAPHSPAQTPVSEELLDDPTCSGEGAGVQKAPHVGVADPNGVQAAHHAGSAGPNGVQADPHVQVADAAAVRQAGEAWAGRLTVEGGGKPRRKPSRGSRIARSRLKALAGDKHVAADLGLPAEIPWEGENGGDVREARFVCDVQVEGLARQLRLCGLDASIAPYTTREHRYLAYRHMVEAAESEGRMILTADSTFIKGGYSRRAYFVRSNNKKEQLSEVLSTFRICLDADALLSRCACCNGEFIPRPLRAGELPPDCDVSAHVRRLHDEFWVCANSACAKVYWQGSQYGNAITQLADRVGLTLALKH